MGELKRWRLEGGFFIIDSLDTLAQMMETYVFDALKETHKSVAYAEGKAAGFRDAAMLIRATKIDIHCKYARTELDCTIALQKP